MMQHREELTKTVEEETKRRGGDEEALGGVKVNYSSTTTTSKGFTVESTHQRIFEINRLLATSREQNSPSIPVFYREVRTGRYTAQNAVLQGYHRSVRYAALRDCYEYDLEAAHQNILVQLLDRKQINFPELNVLREYVSNKQGTRERLATDLNTSIAEHKYIVFSNINPLDNNKSLFVVVITLSALNFNILSKSINLNGFDEKL